MSVCLSIPVFPLKSGIRFQTWAITSLDWSCSLNPQFMSPLGTPPVLPEFQFGSHPHLVILYFYLICHSRNNSIWKLGAGLWCTRQTLHLRLCTGALTSGGWIPGVKLWAGDAHAVHFSRCLPIALLRACHRSHFHQQDMKWPFSASPWHSWSPVLQCPRSTSSLPGAWGTQGAGLGLLAAHRWWSHPRTAGWLAKAGSAFRLAFSGCWFSDLSSCRWHCSGHAAGGAVTVLESLYGAGGEESLSNGFCYICFHE